MCAAGTPMSSEPSDPARQPLPPPAPPPPPPPAPQGRLVFDGSSEADSAVADRLHDSLFPCQPTDRRRSLYGPQPGDDASDTASDGDGLLSGDRPEVTPGPDGGDAPSAEPWLEDTEASEPLPEPESLSAAARRVLERRQLIRERFARRQRSVRELQRRCGQRPARGAPLWTPPVLVYRPPPLPALQRRLLEAGQLADTVPEPTDLPRRQIDEFSRRHLQVDDDTPR